MRKTCRVVMAALPIALGSVVLGVEPTVTPLAQEVHEAFPQIQELGLTADEYFENQAALFASLQAAMPVGALETPIRVEFTDEELQTIWEAPVTEEPTPMRVGVVKALTPPIRVANLDAAGAVKGGRGTPVGSIQELADGTLAWSQSITSDGAGGIRVHLRGASLPDGVQMYFFSPEGESYGPYVGRGPNDSGEFWTESLFSSTGVLMLVATSPEELRQATFTITDLGHISQDFVNGVMGQTASHGSGFCGNLTCLVDATCFNVAAANPAKDAIAKMEWIAGAFIYTCTGGLLSDNNPSQNNYFLTANHCLSKSATAKNVQFYWRFRTSSCNGACPSNTGWPYKTTGSAVRATNRRGDFTLLQLNSNPPAGSVFLGWTNSPVANANGTQLYRISNPDFGPQVYSQHNVDTGAGTCSGWPRGERIYSRDITGAIDGGASGSPVVNGSSQVVGQLSGSCGFSPSDPCQNGPGEANATVDGAFAYYYSSVQPFLAP